MTRGYLNTIDSLEKMKRAYYSEDSPLNNGNPVDISKADNPVVTGQQGIHRPRYGAAAFSQLNDEVNAFSVLPKYTWPQSGWRVRTGRQGSTGGGGVDPAGTLPDTGRPSFREISAEPATVAHAFDATEEIQALESGDDAIEVIAEIRADTEETHVKRINEQLLTDADTLPSALPGSGEAMESLDRVASSGAEASAKLDTGDADMYGGDVDRSSDTVFDAYVDFNNANRTLSKSMVRDAIRSIKQQSGYRPNVILTGHDTMTELQSIYESNVRISGQLSMDSLNVQLGENGVQTAEGIEAGVQVAAIEGIPVIETADAPDDGISRLYFLNTRDPQNLGRPFLGIAMLKPTQYFEAGINSTGDPFGVDGFRDEGPYRTSAQLVCTNFKAQGKIRDLKAA